MVKIKKSVLGDHLDDRGISQIVFTEEILSALPLDIREYAEGLDIPRERDMFVLGAIPTLASLIPGVKMVYDYKELTPAMYAAIIAPPASGKGRVSDAGRFVTMIDEEKQKSNDNEADESDVYHCHLYAGDSSAAALAKALDSNKEGILILESEADTVSKGKRNEWGAFDDLYRKAFHHEVISVARKKERYKVRSPILSVVLAGTESQMPNLFTSIENGLFSRFLVYYVNEQIPWKSVSLNEKVQTTSDDSLERYGKSFYEFYKGRQVQFRPTVLQTHMLNENFSNWDKELTEKVGLEYSGVVKRMGLIVNRICMVLTALRYKNKNEKSEVLVPTKEEYTLSIEVGRKLLGHSVLSVDAFRDHFSTKRTLKELVDEYIPKDKALRIRAMQEILKTYGEIYSHKQFYNVLQDMVKAGKAEILKKGVYVLKSEEK